MGPKDYPVDEVSNETLEVTGHSQILTALIGFVTFSSHGANEKTRTSKENSAG